MTPRELTAPGALAGPSPSGFNWSPVGAELAYVGPQDGQDILWLYDAASGEKRLLLDPAGSPGNIDVTSAQWSPDGNRLLLTGDESPWLLDAATGELTPLGAGSGDPTSVMFTPEGTHVSYVQGNDLYLLDIASGDVQRLTSDGGETVFNGTLDWVYTEELATRAAQPAYAWSPDGAWLIYLRLDESAVNQDPVTDYRPVPATVSYTRYPTVGTANPIAMLHALAQGSTAPPLEVPLPEGAEYVLPFFTWTPDSKHALYITVNRDHTELALNRWTPQSGELRALITETASDWINEDRYAAPVFIGDGSQFLWISERDGFMHLYLYTAEGELVRQVTQGDWMIDSSAYNLLTPGRPVHVDPEGSWAYVITTRTSPLQRQIDRVNIAGGEIEQVSQQPGFHLAALSADGAYLVDQFSDVDTPPVTTIVPTGGGDVQVLAEAAGPALDLPQVAREFLTVKAHDGTDLYAQLVKPENFDPARQYPVVVHWYGGPGLQMVSDRYGTTNIFNIIERDVLYTEEGFLVWRLDNRGSFGRGHAFESPIFGELGKAALDDQLAGIEYLQTLPYVDATRIGTDGKSFGGYMTLYALLHAPEVVRCGVAGAAPTDWSYYDTIYTERYMRTPDKNPDGYAATNLLDIAGQIEARPLLIHGLDDTNVHLQNTVNFIQELEANDKLFNFVPLPNLSHSFTGDGLVAALAASVDYLRGCLAGAPAGGALPAPAASFLLTTTAGEDRSGQEADLGAGVITATQVITYTPGPPTGEPQAGRCWVNSLAAWRADAWRCFVGNSIYDPCLAVDGDVICGASPVTSEASFALDLSEPLPPASVPVDTTGHAWLVELSDGAVCEFATGATGGVDGERINYLCASPDPGQRVVILGDLQPGAVWTAQRAVLSGSMPDLVVAESVLMPARTVWR
ncbi:MAG: DPP IV N-terminal domain-containing protein [Caldilineales bacterium]